MPRFTIAPILLLILTVTTIPAAIAEMKDKHQGHDMNNTKSQHKDHGMAKSKGHHQFSPQWKDTLTDVQKLAIDKMHLKLATEMAVLKAKVDLAEKELNVYTISAGAKQSRIDTMIDGIIAVKKEILTKRYAHLLEMRMALTDEQRISYDNMVINRSGTK